MNLTTPYNLTRLQNSLNVNDLFRFANDSTSGALSGLGITAIFFVLTLAFKARASFEEAILASSFICFGLSLFLRYAGLINFMFVLGFLIIMAFSGLYVYINNR